MKIKLLNSLLNFPQLLILFLILQNSQCNPHNFTHRLRIGIDVDKEYKGDLYVGIWREESTKEAVDNFMALCLCYSNIFLKSGKVFCLKGHEIYRIYKDEWLIAGDINWPDYSGIGNETIYQRELDPMEHQNQRQGLFKHKDTPYYIEEGSIGLDAGARPDSGGDIGSEFHIFLSRPQLMDFRFLVFAQVYKNKELLHYLSKTAGEKNGMPRRLVTFRNCELIQ